MNNRKIREINFDLYSKKCPSNAYKQIKKFMQENGFEHRLWSGYISKNKMTDSEVAKFNKKLWGKFPWLENGVRRLDVTNVENKFNLIELHKEQIEQDESKIEPIKSSSTHTMSLSELKKEVDKRGQEPDKSKEQEVHKERETSSRSAKDKER